MLRVRNLLIFFFYLFSIIFQYVLTPLRKNLFLTIHFQDIEEQRDGSPCFDV